MSEKSVLPDAVKQLPIADRIERLRQISPTDAGAIEMILDDCLEFRWAQTFHSGPKGGLRPRSQLPVLKGGA